MTKTYDEFCDRLRTAADFVQAHPELPRPHITAFDGSSVIDLNWYLHLNGRSLDEAGQKAAAAAIVRAVGGKWDKDEDGEEFSFRQKRDGFDYHVMVKRSAVCERIVVGTEDVQIPATPARPELPARTEVREVVEWRCEPLLADSVAELAAITASVAEVTA